VPEMENPARKQRYPHILVIGARHLWVIDPKKGMGYWLLESMGYGHKIPANQLGRQENVWVTREYGLSGVWIIRESTVYFMTSPSRERPYEALLARLLASVMAPFI
jgi:hypothetical protein